MSSIPQRLTLEEELLRYDGVTGNSKTSDKQEQSMMGGALSWSVAGHNIQDIKINIAGPKATNTNVLPQRPSTMAGYKNQTTKFLSANFCSCLLLLSVDLRVKGFCPYLFSFLDNKLRSFNKITAMPALTDWPLSLDKLYTKNTLHRATELSHSCWWMLIFQMVLESVPY